MTLGMECAAISGHGTIKSDTTIEYVTLRNITIPLGMVFSVGHPDSHIQ